MHTTLRLPSVRLACLFLLATLGLFTSCKHKRKLIDVNPEFSRYIDAYTSGTISKKNTIRIQLAGDANTEDAAKVLEIIYPENDAKIYVPLELSGEKGRTVFTATHRNPNAKLFWHIDDEFAGTTERFHQLGLNPPPGKHILTVVDQDGNSVSRRFEILQKEKN